MSGFQLIAREAGAKGLRGFLLMEEQFALKFFFQNPIIKISS